MDTSVIVRIIVGFLAVAVVAIIIKRRKVLPE